MTGMLLVWAICGWRMNILVGWSAWRGGHISHLGTSFKGNWFVFFDLNREGVTFYPVSRKGVHGYLAHKKTPTTLGSP